MVQMVFVVSLYVFVGKPDVLRFLKKRESSCTEPKFVDKD